MSRLDAVITPYEMKSISHLHDTSRIYMAEVMDTRDPKKMGDIKVWVINSNTDKKDPKNWVIAHCCSSYGETITSSTSKESYSVGLTSFGCWSTIPYVGNYVFIFYPNVYGEYTNPYWFGSPMGKSNEMLPGISYNLTDKNDFTAKCEVNYKNNEQSKNIIYEPLQDGLEIQGLNKDRLRGISTASSFRDTPSHCYGFLTPLGNQMVIDDGWSLGDSNINWLNDPRVNNIDNQEKDDYGAYHSKKDWIASLEKDDKENKLNRFHGGFRFRTRNGTQLLILDVGNIYMINKDGTAWVELSEDGYIDCYSQNGISAASDGDINLHAININIEALNKISLKSSSGVSIETDGNVMVKSASMNVSSRVSVPNLIADTGQIGVFKSMDAEITGIFSGSLQGTAYYATAAGTQPIEQPLPNIKSIKSDAVKVTDTVSVKQQIGKKEIFSISNRVPTHEPWAGHDKNDFIPPLEVKQMMKTEESEQVNNTVSSNQVRR